MWLEYYSRIQFHKNISFRLMLPFLDYSHACILFKNLEVIHEENLLESSYSALALMLGALYNLKIYQ